MKMLSIWKSICLLFGVYSFCIGAMSISSDKGRGWRGLKTDFLRTFSSRFNYRSQANLLNRLIISASRSRDFILKPKDDSALDVYTSLKKNTNNISKQNWLKSKQYKLVLASLGSACAVFDLMEELVERLPSIHRFLKPILRPKFSVLLLCLIHLLELLHEFMAKINDNRQIRKQAELTEQVAVILEQRHSSEEEAARAHDKAAIAIFAQDAVLNFNYPNTELDEYGQPPKYLSKYRGVKWSNKHRAWQVDGAYLGYI